MQIPTTFLESPFTLYCINLMSPIKILTGFFFFVTKQAIISEINEREPDLSEIKVSNFVVL